MRLQYLIKKLKRKGVISRSLDDVEPEGEGEGEGEAKVEEGYVDAAAHPAAAASSTTAPHGTAPHFDGPPAPVRNPPGLPAGL